MKLNFTAKQIIAAILVVVALAALVCWVMIRMANNMQETAAAESVSAQVVVWEPGEPDPFC